MADGRQEGLGWDKIRRTAEPKRLARNAKNPGKTRVFERRGQEPNNPQIPWERRVSLPRATRNTTRAKNTTRRAGVSGWPRLFHSMRASWQTELQREFPLHVVCSWLGNSPRIAQQSYLLVTEDDFARTAGAMKVMVEG
jgi:hypothetical protein